MVDHAGAYYSEGSSFKPVVSFPENAFDEGRGYYEVIRVMDRSCLFLEDHLRRLQESVRLSGLDHTLDLDEISALVQRLIAMNNLDSGNIRLVLQVREQASPVLYTYCVPFSYPKPGEYAAGVPTAVFPVTRENPNIKQYPPQYQRKMREFISSKAIYEALLCDDKHHITEGSKSNVFFVRDNVVFTAPGEAVLKGITREKVIKLCNQLNFNLMETFISIDSLPSVEAAFVTGTSPRLLPVCRIDDLHIPVGHPVMRALMKAYDELIGEDISRWKKRLSGSGSM
jgi:branched-chain amino acid aminotransferase